MALQELLKANGAANKKVGLSEERVTAVMPYLRQYVAFWREYPDLFVDFLQTGGNPKVEKKFKFYSYQRIFLRVSMRYKYIYAVFPRGYSKSFLSIMGLMIKCILYPRCKLFVTSGGKGQAASIVQEKVNEICTLIPAFDREIDRRPGQSRITKDYVKFVFKNGSYFDILAARETSRGQRRHGGVMEECVSIDGNILSTVILPTMNVDRRAMDGTSHEDEPLNKSQVFITTSGFKGTFGYEKLIQMLVWMATEPDKAFIMGGTWRIPVLMGLQSPGFISDMKRDGTFNEAAFGREYESVWSGTSDGAFFSAEDFDKNRVMLQSERKASEKLGNGGYYVVAADVGRKGCATAVCVIKVLPQQIGPPRLLLVYMDDLEDMHFEDQAVYLKKLYYQYKARRLVIDGNGLGIGLIDYMVKPQIGGSEDLVDFGVYNDDDGYYNKFKSPQCEQNAIYIIKANAAINTEAHTEVHSNLSSGRLSLLIDERDAKEKLLSTKVGQAMNAEQRAEYLKPYALTSILKEEMFNLREETQGVNIILKQANRRINKDKFSALEYGLYYIKAEEASRHKKRFNAKDWVLWN